MSERVPVPLAIHHSPICLTYAFFTLPNLTYVFLPLFPFPSELTLSLAYTYIDPHLY